MKTMAKHWQEEFEDVMHDGRKGQLRQRLEWFLFKLHLAVHRVETQSDGTKLLIFDDGSVYGEESELDALLTQARRRKSNATAFSHAARRHERCRKGQRNGRLSSRTTANGCTY